MEKVKNVSPNLVYKMKNLNVYEESPTSETLKKIFVLLSNFRYYLLYLLKYHFLRGKTITMKIQNKHVTKIAFNSISDGDSRNMLKSFQGEFPLWRSRNESD